VRILIPLLFCIGKLSGQTSLLPDINSGIEPNDSAQIAAFTFYIDTTDLFMQSGYQAGQTVNDFTYYDTAHVRYNLDSLLQLGNPVVVMSGSFTCPRFRSAVLNDLPALFGQYSSQVTFLIVYTLEAHPMFPYLSPFSGTVDVTATNINQGILYPQSDNYFQRRQMAKLAQDTLNIPCAVVIDDTANTFYHTFGPAPSNVYVITTSGTVYSKYGWLHNNGLFVEEDLQALLSSLSIVENEADPEIVFPNPISQSDKIVISGDGNLDVEIISTSGQVVFHDEGENNMQIGVHEAAIEHGLYVIRVTDESGRISSRKLIY
jgi:Iodothyronine deiodinase/Secretion system C-terminal sorting domain